MMDMGVVEQRDQNVNVEQRPHECSKPQLVPKLIDLLVGHDAFSIVKWLESIKLGRLLNTMGRGGRLRQRTPSELGDHLPCGTGLMPGK